MGLLRRQPRGQCWCNGVSPAPHATEHGTPPLERERRCAAHLPAAGVRSARGAAGSLLGLRWRLLQCDAARGCRCGRRPGQPVTTDSLVSLMFTRESGVQHTPMWVIEHNWSRGCCCKRRHQGPCWQAGKSGWRMVTIHSCGRCAPLGNVVKEL